MQRCGVLSLSLSLSDYVSHRSRDARWVGVVLQLDRGWCCLLGRG
jgi:hypothetical protein